MVEAKNVSIRYVSGEIQDIGLKDWVIHKIKRDLDRKEYWAVEDVSFRIEKGDFLGIIGTNGAGKSTILKSIAGILPPQKGHVTTDGRVVALLELGTGFDGELNLRENVYMRGALLGYSQAFLDERVDEILEFAELTEFQNRRFKQLSSGMKSRLAFSISCLVNPDILILDEVLSVGDGAFRKKSEEKMMEIIRGGATTIFVSHSLSQIRRLCNKILWLDHGKMVGFAQTGDEVRELCAKYERYLRMRKSDRNAKPSLAPLTAADKQHQEDSSVAYYATLSNLFLRMLSEPACKQNFMQYFKEREITHIAVYGENAVYQAVSQWLSEAGVRVDYIVEDANRSKQNEIRVVPRKSPSYPETRMFLIADLYNAASIKNKLRNLTNVPHYTVQDLVDGTYRG